LELSALTKGIAGNTNAKAKIAKICKVHIKLHTKLPPFSDIISGCEGADRTGRHLQKG